MAWYRLGILLVACGLVVSLTDASIFAQSDSMREWSDSTGNFSITAKLLEMRDGTVYLENEQGKTLKIPMERLSQSDQEFLAGGNNPFEMVEERGGGSTRGSAAAASSRAATADTASGMDIWDTSMEMDWSDAEQIPLVAAGEWNVSAPSAPPMEIADKPTPLQKKTSFHEKMTGMAVNLSRGRAVVGYSVSFGVSEPKTRLALIDLKSGKAIHTAAVTAAMKPLAVLDNGSTVLMVGSGDGRSSHEKHNELQLWKVKGKSIERSASWIPYADQPGRFGRTEMVRVMKAEVVSDDRVLLLGSNGRLALWNIVQREPIWFADMNDKNLAFSLSADRSLVAMFNDKSILVADPQTGEIIGSLSLPDQTRVGWNRICWGPDGQQLLISSVGDLRVIDVTRGEIVQDVHLGDQPIATNGLEHPDADYALLNGSTLVHIPSRIRVCEYRELGQVSVHGETSFIALSSGDGGLFVPSKFPHPPARQMLQQAQDDPQTFLVHPGVGVAIDISKVSGGHAQKVQANLAKAVEASGYKLDPSSSIKITAEVSGPKQEAVSYIGRGSHVVQQYTSTASIMWNGRKLWSRSGTNIPGMISLSQGETIESYLAKAGQNPNLSIFEKLQFPEFIQRPSGDGSNSGSNGALMTSRFTLRGLVDSQ